MAAYTGKVIVLTGASQGIGRALAVKLAEERPRLVLAARDREALEAVAAECQAKGADTLVVPTDVSDVEACRKLIEATVERFKVVDVLVNNAGVGMISRFDAMPDLSNYERLMKVNYLGCVHPTYFALPYLKQSRGQIVVMASLAGLTGVPTRTGYAATKHAVIGFFDSLRIEVAPDGVGVTIVCPYFVRSEIHRRSVGPDGKPLVTSPMQEARIMTAEECAAGTVLAMTRRQRILVMTLKGKAGRFVRLVAPGVVDLLARRAVEKGR
jgi:short-subunit dehydrogenase